MRDHGILSWYLQVACRSLRYRVQCGDIHRSVAIWTIGQVLVPIALNTFNPMKRMQFPLFLAVILAVGCKKDEVKEYTVTLDATCWGCIVQYAAGPDRGLRDTLFGSVNDAGDTLLESGQYELVMKQGDALFMRACRLDPDTVFGNIEMHASGAVPPITVVVDTSEPCATINQAVTLQ